MHLSHLGLVNFRNYARLSLDLAPGATVFQGENGQGKTNLLEAVYFLATTRSPRASVDRELVWWGAQQEGPSFARLEARVQKQSGELHLEVLLREEHTAEGDGAASAATANAAVRSAPGTSDTPGQDSASQGGMAAPAPSAPGGPSMAKTIKVNGLPVRAGQLVGQTNVVFFSPEDISLLAGPPAGRRRYLDITNSQVNHLYLRALQRFNRVLTQRNHLLRQVREGRQPRDLLEFWTEELAKAGTYVVRQRMEMIAAVNAAIGAIYHDLAGRQDELRLVYTSTATRREAPESEPKLAYRERLAEMQQREIEQGITLVGPHRDDFSALVDGIDVGTYGSRGQQRLAVLAVKLAEADYMRARSGEEPILLLDDILSELDATRRQYVLARVARAGQSLITTADLDAFDPAFLEQATLYRVERGALA